MEAAGFDAAEVEDVIDEAEEVLGIDVDVAHEAGLLAVERTFSFFDEELGETDDGVKGRAEFVADARHKLTFELIKAFGFPVPCLELGHVTFLQRADAMFGEFALGHVADDGGDVDAVLSLHRAEADFHGKFAAVFALGKEVEGEAHGARHSSICKGFAAAVVGGAVGGRDQQIDILAHEFFAGVAEHLLCGVIGDDDDAVGVDLEDGVGGVFDELAIFTFSEYFSAGVGLLQGEEDFAVGKGTGGVGTLGNVAGDLGDAEDGAAGVNDGREAKRDEDLPPILVFTGDEGVVDATSVAEGFEEEVDALLLSGPGEEGAWLANGLLGFVAKDASGGGVPGGDGAAERHAEDGIVRGLDNGGEPALGDGGIGTGGWRGREILWISDAVAHRVRCVRQDGLV
jgi:hypothetical protein